MFSAKAILRGSLPALMLLAGVLLAGKAGAAEQTVVCPFEVPPEHPPFVLGQNVRTLKADEPLRVLAIGSSSTQGFGASAPARAYPAQLALRLQAALAPRQVEVVNAGYSERKYLRVSRTNRLAGSWFGEPRGPRGQRLRIS